jgi:putative aminopeptidase FrvX
MSLVDDIKADGTLVLKMRGGMLQWLWEAQPAIIHGTKGKINAVFEPRADYEKADKRYTNSPLTVFAGFTSKSEAEEAGIELGTTTVTMPKEMIRLSENRVTARGFDDRVGSAALLLSLDGLDPNSLTKKITYVWSVEEEIGLYGATFAAENLKDATIVHPIDTYVSSDDPYTDEYFAHCPLGEGAVIRVLESINFISRDNLKKMQDLAKKNQIDVQYGMTAGGTDGQPFLAYGIPSIPLSWPGRYSHSPIEIMDFRDMDNLIGMIKAIVNESD